MASKKNKKRSHSRTVELKRQAGQEQLANEKGKKRMDPTARALLYGDLVFLALLSILEHEGLISGPAGGVGTIVGVVLLLAALWFQFRKKPDTREKGNRL